MYGTSPQPTTPAPKTRVIAPYAPLPWQVAPWRDRGPVILLTGSAGGGKSRLAAEKIHGYCLKYPGATALVARKVKVSMTSGAVLLFERTVIGDDPRVRHKSSKSRFEYANGSLLLYAGLEDEDQRERLKSIGQDGAIDISWMEEANEFEEADYNAIGARTRGRAAPWRQRILTCNPDAPTHWIYRRLIQHQEARVYYSGRHDNPHNPADYDATMNTLTGIDDLRLNKGQWVQATGLVYDVWDESQNVTELAEYIPDGGPITWALDDGYSAGSAPATRGLDRATGAYVHDAHPRVILWCQQRSDGRLCVFAESYACLTLSDAHLTAALAEPYPAPEFVAHGPGAAEIRGRIHAAGLYARQCTANVEESIKELRRAFAPDIHGWRRILVHPRCVHFRQEMLSYRYGPDGKPVKAFDHGPDSLRGLVWVMRYEL
jgi:Phage terminase large subunit